MLVWSSLFCWSDWNKQGKNFAPTAVVTVQRVREMGGGVSDSFGPLHQSQVGKKGVLVGGGR